MGNCIVLQEKDEIKIMKADGEILKFQSPLKVHEALEKFPGYVISDVLPLFQQLDPMAEMRCGQLYHLIQQNPSASQDSTVRIPSDSPDSTVKIKLVLSKKELKEILSKGGIPFDAMLSHLNRESKEDDDGDVKHRCIRRMPALESIPEGYRLY